MAHKNQAIQKVFDLERQEFNRQQKTLSLIASENLAFQEVLQISGSVLTNKYAEGYPGNRYYSGCQYVDQIENIAIEECKKAFGCNFANVQPLSGSVANFSVYKACLKPGDTILAMNLSAGGHLTHSSSVSFVSYIYNVASYGINLETQKIDFDEISKLAHLHKPKLIIAGGSSYSLQVDFSKFREIADSVGAMLFGDVSHLSGLIISNLHTHCFPYCDVVMSTTHKQLCGPRGAVILWNNEEYTKKINSAVFPGTQGGPHPGLIAAKAVAMAKCNEPIFKSYFQQVVANCQAMCQEFKRLNCVLVSGGSTTHLLVLDVFKTFGITGDIAEKWLESAGIVCNKNVIANDLSPKKPSGLRFGTLTGTHIGFKESEFTQITSLIFEICKSRGDEAVILKSKKIMDDLLKKGKNFFDEAV